MAQLFKVHTIQLTKQLVTASGDNLLYVNGNPVVAGVSGALNQTGLYLVSQITATGQSAVIHANGIGSGLSGALSQSGSAILSVIANTGQQAWNAANNNAINLSGDLTLTGQTLRALTLGGDTNLSGQLTVTGQTLYQIITGLSGQAVTDYATRTQLNTLSGFTTGLSGYLQSQINEANADVSSINGQSGVLTLAGTGGLTVISGGVGLILISGDNSISGALTQTGVTLGGKIDSLSGYVGNISGGLEARITATGNAAVVHANGIGTNLSGNLTTTGQTLYQMMTGLSGQANINYATVTNLALTGSNLYVTLTGLSGQAVIDYATKTNLTLTGQTLFNTIIGGDTNLSGNLTLTGQTLRALTLGGDTNLSGNLTITGQTLYNLITAASGQANVNYAPALANYVYQSGVQSITGIKTFLSELRFNSGVKTPVRFFGPTNYTLASGDYFVIATGTTSSTTGIFPSATNYSGVIFNLINGGTASLQISGNIGPDTNPALAPWDSIQAYATSGQWWYLRQTGSPLLGMVTSLSGFVGNVSGALNTLIAITGQQAWTAAQNNAINLSGNLTATGQTLLNAIVGGDTNLSGNLTLTGQTLQGRIDSLSGFVGQVSGGLETRITATGNAAVAHANGVGVNLSGNLTQTGSVLNDRINSLSGYTNTQDYLTGLAAILYASGISGVLNTSIIATGNSGVLHSNGIGVNLSGNLTQTGANLLSAIADTGSQAWNAANNNAINLSGALTQTGTLLSALRITGSAIQNTLNLIGTGAVQSWISGTNLYISGNQADSINISGNLAQTGVALVSLIAQTGQQAWLAAQNNALNLSGNLTQTGVLIEGQLISLSGWAASALNLASTGSNLYILITGLSGQANTNYATVANLALTGQQAWSAANNNALNLSGNLTQTGATLLSVIAQTGQGSILYTNGASGALQSYINSVSGFVGNVSGGLEARITQTGTAAINHANSIGQTISGNLTQTGSTLDNKINSLSGFVGNVSGGLETRIAQTGSAAVVHANGIGTIISGNVTQTGITLLGFIIGGDTNLSGNLTQTGSTLNTRVNSLSGWADQIFVHRTGQELISGRKIFRSSPVLTGIEFAGASGSGVYASVQTDGAVSFAGPSGGLLSIDSGVNGSVFAVTNQYEAPYLDIYEDGRIYVGGFLSNALFISGSGAAFGVNYVPSGYSLFVSGNAQYIGNIYSGTTGGQVINIADLFYPRLTNPSGYVTGATLIATGSSLYVMLTGMSGAFNTTIQSTGQQAWSAANNNALNLSGNLTQTGVTLRALTLGGDTNLSGNLTLTGQTLQIRIDSLSGYAAPARADYFYRTGAQTVSGDTTVQGNLTIISGQYEPQKTVSANYSVLSTDSRIYCNNGSPITLTLPSLASVSGQIVNVKLINTGSVILTGTAGQLFDGSPSYVIVGQYQSRQIHGGDATNWYLW